MRLQNVASADYPIRIVHYNVEQHVAAMTDEAAPSKAILEMSFVASFPELEHGAADNHRDLHYINNVHIEMASSHGGFKTKHLNEWHLNLLKPPIARAHIGTE